MCSCCSFRCSAKSAQRSYWRGQWLQRTRNEYWSSARFWRPISSRSIKFNCQYRTIHQISRKHDRLDWYVSRRFQQGIFSTPTSIGRPSTTRLFNLWGHTGKDLNIPIQCYTPYVHIVYDIIPDIILDICLWYHTQYLAWCHTWYLVQDRLVPPLDQKASCIITDRQARNS